MIRTKNYKEFWLEDGTQLSLQEVDRVLNNDIVELISFAHQRDTVELTGHKWVTSQRATHPLLVGLLDVKSKYIYGMSSRGTPQYLFTPYNESYPPFIVGCSNKDRTTNKIVLVRFENWHAGQKFPMGGLVDVLGNSGDLKVEAKALYWQYSPWKPPSISLSPKIQSDERISLCDKYTFNIDPPGCKDIDDVLTIYVDPTVPDKYTIVITISDVSEFIDPGSPLDIHAAKVGQSLYSTFLPPRNMLPQNISENVLSLLPGQQRFGVSLFCNFEGTVSERCATNNVSTVSKEDATNNVSTVSKGDATNNVSTVSKGDATNNVSTVFKDSKFALTIVENKESFTYDEFTQRAPAEMVKMIRQGAESLRKSTSYFTEPLPPDPHKWIEVFMIYYNLYTAIHLKSYGAGILRGQKEGKEVIQRYQEICPELAYEAAVYTTVENILPHKTLNYKQYCYASSPIRRYVDIVNQRILKMIIEKQYETLLLLQHENMEQMVEQQNQLQKSAKKQARDDFLLSKISSRLVDGIVFDVTEKIIKIYIPSWKRIVKVRSWICSTPSLKDTVQLKFFYNPNQISWKERIVFQLCNPLEH